jgi:polyisoprenoid-binding protein YceI
MRLALFMNRGNQCGRRCIISWLSALLFLISGSLFAQEQTFQLNPEKTSVHFTLGDVLHTVHGTFQAKSGTIHFNPATGQSSGSFVIDAASGDSGNQGRDHKMHKEILESQKYGEISFSPTRIIGPVPTQGDGTVQMDGIFRLHGSDHPLSLTVPVTVNGNDLTARLHFVIPYVAWGLKNPSTFVLRVSKEVAIDIDASGRLTGLEENRTAKR